MTPSFIVSAEYFYALGARLSMDVPPAQRYEMATHTEEGQLVAEFQRAIDAGVISAAPGGIGPEQAARRLVALGGANDPVPTYKVTPGSSVFALVDAWLKYTGADLATFWPTALSTYQAGHLELVLVALTDNFKPLMDAIKAFPISTVDALSKWTVKNWRDFFQYDSATPRADLLPPFTAPGTTKERIDAFIRRVQRFFDVSNIFDSVSPLGLGSVPEFDLPASEPLGRFAQRYSFHAGGAVFLFGKPWDDTAYAKAITDVFPNDEAARSWLGQLLSTVDTLFQVTDIGQPALQPTLMESLFARGFTERAKIQALSGVDFRDALTGTVAWEYANDIYVKAGGRLPAEGARKPDFHPVNPDGALTNCIPQPHRSPLGQSAYLADMLLVSQRSTCQEPHPDSSPTLGAALATRRGPLGNLAVSAANLGTRLPAIDLVNECLESLVTTTPGAVSSAIYDTAADQVAGHWLDAGTPTAADGPVLHAPETLFAALPEHSSPAVPVKQPAAYVALKQDVSHPDLPYSQPLDVNRSYLGLLGTSRYETLRTFRKDVTELVLDPAKEPADFQRHLRRYPVRIDIAREYLQISPEEHERLFTRDLTDPMLLLIYGFPAGAPATWTQTLLKLPEFLERTGLSYCEFIDLWRSQFVPFRRAGSALGFDLCEPCCIDTVTIEFDASGDPKPMLRQLAIFIRLWRKLQGVPNAAYSFDVLRDICEVLGLFALSGSMNPDFVRQLAAFQMLRDDFALDLRDAADPVFAIGANRTHLLSLWVGPSARKWSWAVQHLLGQIQRHAQEQHGCKCRPSEFIKLLGDNLDPLSRLMGFDPDMAAATWRVHPTHTLRFAEVLAKIYASDFGVGELLFLFTSASHVDGDDPFPLQPDNEASDSPLDLPDDDAEFSLWKLRSKLLSAMPTPAESDAWTWSRMEESLRKDFGFEPPTGAGMADPLHSLFEHFFPVLLESCGCPKDSLLRQYRVPLATTSAAMWNTPPDGPFHYDAKTQQLDAELPLSDTAVLAKLSRIRPLNPEEQRAVRDLYFAPRVEMARFAFLFENFAEAESRLIQEADESKRWSYFQEQFARCHIRARLIASHLAAHVEKTTGQPSSDAVSIALRLLRHLHADENRAKTPWEADDGSRPEVTWGPQPSGGALAALLGLTGTGLLGELRPACAPEAIWREVRGPMDAFGSVCNGWNAPLPTQIPDMGLQPTIDQRRFFDTRNGFAFANSDGAKLGGGQGFSVVWRGVLLVENAGLHGFWAGAPTPDGEEPSFAEAKDRRWRVTLRRGQKTWVLLEHQGCDSDRAPIENAPASCSAPLSLKRGAYEIVIELTQPEPLLDGPEDVQPRTTGFQLKYSGPDTGNQLIPIPLDRLFIARKDWPLDWALPASLTGAARQFLQTRYVSTLRDIRRTYQRAFKAMLLAARFKLSAAALADSGQSEIDFLLAHPREFAGFASYASGPGYSTHRANFDFNLLPIGDNYFQPASTQDQRANPSAKRQAALFDGWERLFDYAVLRRSAQTAPERPIWLLFHEAAENHPDSPAHLLRHMGADLRHAQQLLRYYQTQTVSAYQVSSTDLSDERWASRAWHAERWIRQAEQSFFCRDIRTAQPDLWASEDPSLLVGGTAPTGNESLTRFVREGLVENGEPRRYAELQQINDGLRERARQRLTVYLCRVSRVPLPWGGYAIKPKDLSELLLLDVEVGLGQRSSRIAEAVSAVQIFVQRARLGLEPGWNLPDAFLRVWDQRYQTLHTWETCRRRELYRENWIELDELDSARQSEAFRLLEAELSRATLTVPSPGGLAHFDGHKPPTHPGLGLLQDREPATMRRLAPPREGFDIQATPEHDAQPSWLATLPTVPAAMPGIPSLPSGRLPLWVEAAVRLGVRFWRVAAAGYPVASAKPEPSSASASLGCCMECGQPHAATADEYYFWIMDSRHYTKVFQSADVTVSGTDGRSAWHTDETLPTLLVWDSQPMVHLMWSRVHNGELQPPRRSAEGVRIQAKTSPDLKFLGRQVDSLHFEVKGGVNAPGYKSPPAPGFRYDLAADTAVVLPLLTAPSPARAFPGGLAAYPYFAFFAPGAPAVPNNVFSPATTTARALRAHCRFEAALKWYERAFNPLQEDARWCLPGVDAGGACCQVGGTSDKRARTRSITLSYLETLLEWGDAMMRRGKPESVQQARLIFDTAARILGPCPGTVAEPDVAPPQRVLAFAPGSLPLNLRLLEVYEQVDDRLQRVHTALNAPHNSDVLSRKERPDWNRSPMHQSWNAAEVSCLDDGDWCGLPSPYRFTFLNQKAQELAGEVRGLGAALLAAIEKGDAEYLAALRSSHERQLLDLTLSIRQDQWREADWQVQALQKTKEIAQTNLRYYELLIRNGLNSGESNYQALTILALASLISARALEASGATAGGTPDIWVGTAGFLTIFLQQVPGVGTKQAQVFAQLARILNSLSETFSMTAGLRLTQGGWARREEEWRHQVDVLKIEIEQIERQILAAERRRDIALRELNNHQRQIEHSAEVEDFLRDKFSSHQLYLWLQKETAALHYQMYELALQTARQTQRAFNYERGHTARNFIPQDAWDSLHSGLQAGERLQLALRRMEKAYLDENSREYELTRHISLRQHFPVEILKLKLTGCCEVDIPESMFDLDYPGHYMRRIKSVTLTIPCIVGPFVGVHCRLTLLKSSTRIDPRLTTPEAVCCSRPAPQQAPDCPDRDHPMSRPKPMALDLQTTHNGYQPLPEDSRIVHQYGATDAIATSSGQNDSGLFELAFRDERYLPFELAGAVSRWRIELPPENNYFDLDTLSDVVLHLNYTAREGGDVLRRAAQQAAQGQIPDAGWRLFDVRQDFSNVWQRFHRSFGNESQPRELRLPLGRRLFPFLPGRPSLSIRRLEILFQATEVAAASHAVIELRLAPAQEAAKSCRIQIHSMACSTSAAWPGLYHAVIDIDAGIVGESGEELPLTFRFPPELGEISRVFLICAYSLQ